MSSHSVCSQARRRALAVGCLVAGSIALIGLAAAGAGGPARAAAATTGQFHVVPIGAFKEPVYATGAPGHKHLLFVVERRGTIQVLRHGTEVDRPFLDLRARVDSSFFEDGLLSVAFRPRSSLFYVFYTNNAGNSEIDEFKLDERDPTRTVPGSRRKVLEITRPKKHAHNGGQLQFGPDDLLYISTGDGSYPSDPFGNAQSKHSLLGKLLRIDPRQHGARPYRSPESNPYVGKSGRDKIYALGFRNPWRFSFDRKTGAIAIGDVGEGSWEEVDYEPRGKAKGKNFGWVNFEGDHPYESQTPPPNYAPPIFEYPHTNGCGAITGGYVVRYPPLGSLEGRYLYSDFCTGEIRSLIPRADGAVDDQLVVQDYSLSSFGEGPGGRIYVVSLAGAVSRLEPGP
jgi:glucose/arabinose dehydrogenase